MKTFSVYALLFVGASSVGLLFACGSSKDAATSACDDYFDALYGSGCAGATPPDSEVSRIRGRYETSCSSALALPGVSFTASALEACASAAKTAGCGAFKEAVCMFGAGTLQSNAPCVLDSQCQGEACIGVAGGRTLDGGTSACGFCGIQATFCQGAPYDGCELGTACVTGPADAGTCVPITYGDLGAACDGAEKACKPGLACNMVTSLCGPLGDVGSSCGTNQDCSGSLACVSDGGPSICQSPGTSGASCGVDADCAAGLGCIYGSCRTVNWISSGQRCSYTDRCLVGSCLLGANSFAGTCPKVIPDGQFCIEDTTYALCDTFAQCVAGTCQLGAPAACR